MEKELFKTEVDTGYNQIQIQLLKLISSNNSNLIMLNVMLFIIQTARDIVKNTKESFLNKLKKDNNNIVKQENFTHKNIIPEQSGGFNLNLDKLKSNLNMIIDNKTNSSTVRFSSIRPHFKRVNKSLNNSSLDYRRDDIIDYEISRNSDNTKHYIINSECNQPRSYKNYRNKINTKIENYNLNKAHLVPTNGYFYKRMQDQFDNSEFKAITENRNIELLKRKEQYRPIKKEELKRHAENYAKYMKEQQQKRRKELTVKIHEDEMNFLDQKKFQTEISRSINYNDNLIKTDLKKREMQKKLLREKVALYSSLIPEICPVKINQKKSDELYKLIARLKHPVRDKRDVKADYEISKVIPHKYAPSVSSHSKALSNEESKKINNKMRRSNLYNSINIKVEQSPSPKIGPINILTTKKRKLPVYSWKNEIMKQNINKRSCLDDILKEGKVIMNQATRKHEIMHAGGLDGDLDMGEYGEDLLLSSVKAKIAILEKLE